ncbi:MAG: SDR family NAD(P)-dependent oxidoreductase [Candidatus Hodarchaeota archaeon]
MLLKGKVAIVTGSSRGIGKAIALAMAKEGANIVVAARTEVEKSRLPGTIHKTAEDVRQEGSRALAVRMDITDDHQVEEMVKKTIAEFGKIDILVNNAGIGTRGSLLETSTKTWDLIMKVNLRGTFVCTKMVLPHMIDRKNGHVINISSILERIIRESIVYGVTKAGLVRFTRGLARELKEHNIAVNALCPGVTLTEGVRLLNPNMDVSSLQRPEMWGRYAALVAARDASYTGKALLMEDLIQEFGEI